MTSALRQYPHPKIESYCKHHLPKDTTCRHSQSLKLILMVKDYLCQSESIKSGISSVQVHRSGMSNSLWPHELQHARTPCPSPTPRVYSNSCPSSWWCHPAISSSVVPFSSCPHPHPPPPNQGIFQWVSSSHEVAKALEFQLQRQSFQWTPWTDLL